MGNYQEIMSLYAMNMDRATVEGRKDRHYKIRRLLKNFTIDPTHLERLRNSRPANDEFISLGVAAIMPYLDDEYASNRAVSAFDLLDLLIYGAFHAEINIVNPETNLPLTAYAQIGTHIEMLTDRSTSRTKENDIENWLVKFEDVVIWYKKKALPFTSQWDIPESVPAPLPPPIPHLIKKSALIKEYKNRWPSIQSDIEEQSRNGASIGRVRHGVYNLEMALSWAKMNGKFNGNPAPIHPISIFDCPTSMKRKLP